VEFWVKLIKVKETKDQDARDNLYANCTHVSGSYWLFEGDEDYLDEGIDFKVIGADAIEGYDDLSGSEIKSMVEEAYN